MFTGSEDCGIDCVDFYICTSSLEYKLNLAPPLSKSDPKSRPGNDSAGLGIVRVGQHV